MEKIGLAVLGIVPSSASVAAFGRISARSSLFRKG
jgi:hypothetical protein